MALPRPWRVHMAVWPVVYLHNSGESSWTNTTYSYQQRKPKTINKEVELTIEILISSTFFSLEPVFRFRRHQEVLWQGPKEKKKNPATPTQEHTAVGLLDSCSNTGHWGKCAQLFQLSELMLISRALKYHHGFLIRLETWGNKMTHEVLARVGFTVGLLYPQIPVVISPSVNDGNGHIC